MCVNLKKILLPKLLDVETPFPMIITINTRVFFIDWSKDKKQLHCSLFDGIQVFVNAIVSEYESVISLMCQLTDLAMAKGDDISLYSVEISKQVVDPYLNRQGAYSSFLRLGTGAVAPGGSQASSEKCVCSNPNSRTNKITAHSRQSVTNRPGIQSVLIATSSGVAKATVARTASGPSARLTAGSLQTAHALVDGKIMKVVLPRLGEVPVVPCSKQPNTQPDSNSLNSTEGNAVSSVSADSLTAGSSNQVKVTTIKVIPHNMKVTPRVVAKGSRNCKISIKKLARRLKTKENFTSNETKAKESGEPSAEDVIVIEDTPLATAASPVATEESPIATEKAPAETERAPTETTGSPVATVRSHVATERSPIAPTESPIATTGSPIPTAESPIATVRLETTHSDSDTIAYSESDAALPCRINEVCSLAIPTTPSDSEDSHYPTGEAPLATAESPLATAESSTATTESPLATAGSTIATAESLLATEGSSIATEGSCIATVESPIATVEHPIATGTSAVTNEDRTRSDFISRYIEIMSNMESKNSDEAFRCDKKDNDMKPDGEGPAEGGRTGTIKSSLATAGSSIETTAGASIATAGPSLATAEVADEERIRSEIISRYMEIMCKMESQNKVEVAGNDDTDKDKDVTPSQGKPDSEATTSSDGRFTDSKTHQSNNTTLHAMQSKVNIVFMVQ